LLRESVVHIELTSTLTQEDENKLAPAVLKAISGMLDMLPIAYMIRIETTDEHVVQHISQAATWDAMPPVASDAPRAVVES